MHLHVRSFKTIVVGYTAQRQAHAWSLNRKLHHAGDLRHPRILISGGSGALGTLVALWMSESYSQSEVTLLSRSGNAILLQQLQHSDCQVTALRCDFATQEESSSLLGPLRSNLVMHAGKRQTSLLCLVKYCTLQVIPVYAHMATRLTWGLRTFLRIVSVILKPRACRAVRLHQGLRLKLTFICPHLL